MTRQVVLDTETTGLEAAKGHRIVEIGCIELVDRQEGETFHQLINPERDISAGAARVHRITYEQIKGQPRFADICDSFLEFVRDAEVLAHNAAFDTAFLDAELKRLGRGTFVAETSCRILDTLALARELHPNAHNSLDALCQRYRIDVSMRDKHSALLDAQLLLQVYLAMTGGQVDLHLQPLAPRCFVDQTRWQASDLIVIRANAQECHEHQRFMEKLKRR